MQDWLQQLQVSPYQERDPHTKASKLSLIGQESPDTSYVLRLQPVTMARRMGCDGSLSSVTSHATPLEPRGLVSLMGRTGPLLQELKKGHPSGKTQPHGPTGPMQAGFQPLPAPLVVYFCAVHKPHNPPLWSCWHSWPTVRNVVLYLGAKGHPLGDSVLRAHWRTLGSSVWTETGEACDARKREIT